MATHELLNDFDDNFNKIFETIKNKTDQAKDFTPQQQTQVLLGCIQIAVEKASSVELIAAQIAAANSDKALKEAQKTNLNASVKDNRLIKIIDSLSNLVGMALNADNAAPTPFVNEITACINELKALSAS